MLEHLEAKWTEGELLDSLRRVLKEPSKQSIKEASLKLLDIETA
jgi:hypothetical protein